MPQPRIRQNIQNASKELSTVDSVDAIQTIKKLNHRALAPTVEQRIPNPWVLGSNPGCPVVKSRGLDGSSKQRIMCQHPFSRSF